jgi:hypothetical protein
MDKKNIETFIKKYYLGGTLEQVRWLSGEGALNVTALTSDKKFLTSVTLKKFDGFGDAEVGILETTRLKQMLTALSDDVTFELNHDDEDATRIVSLTVSDSVSTMSYVAADLDVLPKRPKTKSIPDYNVEIKLTDDFIGRFMKAKGSLPDVDLFTLVMSKKKKKLEMVLGYSENINNNRQAISVDAEEGKDTVKEPISFNAKILKEILVANEEVKDPMLRVSEDGLAFLEFDQDGFNSQYYLIKIDVED